MSLVQCILSVLCAIPVYMFFLYLTGYTLARGWTYGRSLSLERYYRSRLNQLDKPRRTDGAESP